MEGTFKPERAKNSNVHTIVKIGLLSAISAVIMLFEIPLWFVPSFYEIDLSEVVVLIGAFALGPMAGVMIEVVKITLNFLINGTITGGIGELANLMIGCALIVPASMIYLRHKSIKSALIGLVTGTVIMTAVGAALNYYVLLPVYASVYGIPVSALVGMGTAVNAGITDLKTLILLGVVPFNLLKGVLTSIITMLLYKKLSPILHK